MRALRRRVLEHTTSPTGRASSSRRSRRSTPGEHPTPTASSDRRRRCTSAARGSRHPIACWSRSTSTARSRRSWTSRRTRALTAARAPRSSASRPPTTPGRDRLGARARRPERDRRARPTAPSSADRTARSCSSTRRGVTIDLRDVGDAPSSSGSRAHRRGGRRGRRRRLDRARSPPGSRCTRARLERDAPARRCSTSPATRSQAELARHHGAHRQASLEFAVRSSDKGESLTRLRAARRRHRVDLRRRRRDRRGRVRRASTPTTSASRSARASRSRPYRVRSPEDVAELLERLADARDAAREGASRWP